MLSNLNLRFNRVRIAALQETGINQINLSFRTLWVMHRINDAYPNTLKKVVGRATTSKYH
jgi:hypothetical protein